MAIRVTLTGILPDDWEADKAFATGGQAAVGELIQQDLPALYENLILYVEDVEETDQPAPPASAKRYR